MPRPPLLLLTAALLLVAAVARADTDDDVTHRARTHLKAGISYYDEARYDDALREMEFAYRLRPLPELQYNIAQCHERLGHARAAADAYRRYLEGIPAAEDRAPVQERIKNLDERAAREARGGAPQAPLVIEKEKIVFKEVVVYRRAPPRPGRAARNTSIAVAVVALGGLAAGTVFSVLAKENADTVTKGGDPQHPVPFTGVVALAQADGRQDRAIAIASFSVAALAAAGTAGLVLLGRHVDREAAKLAERASLAPTLYPGGGGGLMFAGSF